MRRVTAAVLSVVLAVCSLAGCGGDAPDSSADGRQEESVSSGTESREETSAADAGQQEEKEWFGTEDGKTVTLRFWAGIQPEYGYAEIVENFNAEYADKGLQVEYVRYVNDTEGNLQLETYLMGGGEVDVFIGYGNYIRMNKRADAGLLLDYSDMLEQYDFDPYEELGASAMVGYEGEDGSIYGLPTAFNPQGWLLINADMFEDAQVEIPYDGWTYEEFLAACEKLTSGEGQDKVYGACLHINTNKSLFRNVVATATDTNSYYAADRKSTNFDSEVWTDALKMVKDAMDRGVIVSLEEEVSERTSAATYFLTGKTAMYLDMAQTRLCMDKENYPHDFKTAVVPFPVPSAEYATENVLNQSGAATYNDVMCIPASAEYPEASMEFAMWYIRGGIAPLIGGGRCPTWKGITEEDIADVITKKADGLIDVESYVNMLKTGSAPRKDVLSTDFDSEIQTVFAEELENVLYGRSSVEDAMKSAKERADAFLAQ